MAGLRASHRNTPHRRYVVDAFEGIEALQSSSASPSPSDHATPAPGDETSDHEEEFKALARPSESEHDSMSDTAYDAAEVFGPPGGPADQDLDEHLSIPSDPDGPAPKQPRGSRAKRFAVPEEDRLYTRGARDDIHNRLTKSERRKIFFGPGKDDVEIVMRARAKWGVETCFPSRQASKAGFGGFAYSTAYEREVSNSESNWNWYRAGGGKESFAQRQAIAGMAEAEAQAYMPVDGPGGRSFVMGAVNSQKLYTLQPRACLPLDEPFDIAPPPGQKWKEVRPIEYKSGFMLYLGARVHCLDWAPNKPGTKQYLALSVLPARPPAQQDPDAPAFSPHPKHPSSIQIWEFSATRTGHTDKSVRPRLVLVVAAETGDTKALQWCPVPFPGSERLGVLACISYDGSLRVLDVGMPASHGTEHQHVDTFPVQSKPPDTVCTCLTWIDSRRLAAGCANGCVAIWDVADCLNSRDAHPRPASYTSICTSYILAITSAWPSFPNMLMTTSVSGQTTLTDISRPFSDPSATALGQRVRVGHNTLAWLEHAKSAIFVEDNLTIRACALRRWFNSIGVGKIKSLPTCTATSPCHPFVLLGSAGGDVTGNNPIRRVTDGGKMSMWQQDWFRHEWTRPAPEEQEVTAIDSAAAPEHSRPGGSGLSRIVEGFKAERVSLEGSSAPKTRRGVVYKTVYEEKTAITALAWNPNLHVAGWAAAGMADGLLRVEDIAA